MMMFLISFGYLLTTAFLGGLALASTGAESSGETNVVALGGDFDDRIAGRKAFVEFYAPWVSVADECRLRCES
jgi:hypothetical protein